MFRRIEEGGETVAFSFEGHPMGARSGDSVAVALLAQGHRSFRTTPVTGAERGPFCMMGTCFDCLVEIDGMPNRQSCLVRVEDGMEVRRQRGTGAGAE